MNPIAFDTETALIRTGLLAPPLVCLSYADGTGAGLVHHSEARDLVVAMLESDRVLVGHNVAFDFSVLVAKWPDLMPAVFAKYERGQVTDTLLRQKLIDIAGPTRYPRRYSLAECVLRWFGRVMEKDEWRLRYAEFHDIPLHEWPEGARRYAIGDAVATLDVWTAQEKAQDLHLADQYRQARAAWWLHLMSSWGLRTDPSAVETLARAFQADYDAIESGLVSAGLVRSNGTRNTKAAAARMVEVCADKFKLKVTGTGKPQLDRDTCESVGDPVLADYAKLSGLKKKIGTDIPLLRRGLIQARYNSLLETGRTSSSPNVQNLPRKGGQRECFVSRDGKVFAAADYSGFELCTVSQVIITTLGIESKLAQALNRGFDPHLEMARRIVGCTYDDAKARIRDDDVDTARQVGKVCNFGFPGGLGPGGLVRYARSGYGVELTEDQARGLKEHWTQAWPEFVLYFRWVGQQCEAGPAKIEQAFVERYRGGCSYCEACNTLFQGLAADAAKRAGFLIAQACYVDTGNILYGARPVLFIHDEFILEVDDNDRAGEAALELARLMVLGAAPFLPDVPPKAEPYLMRRWSKKAKPVWSEGRLVPWSREA